MILLLLSNCLEPFLLSSNERSYTNSMNFLFSNCFFSRSTHFSGNGGVLYIYNINSFLKVEYCVFYRCIAGSTAPDGNNYGGGGAIYYLCETFGFSEMKFVCAIECMTNSGYYGQFAYIRPNKNQINSLFQISVQKSSNSLSLSRYYTILLLNGYQKIQNSNYSNNENTIASSISINTAFDSQIVLTKFNNCYNCTSSLSGSLYYSTSQFNDSISFLNVISNRMISNTDGVLFFSWINSVNISRCIFSNNINKLIKNYNSNSINLFNCYLNHEIINLGNIFINMSLNFNIQTQTYQIMDYFTFLCLNNEQSKSKRQISLFLEIYFFPFFL